MATTGPNAAGGSTAGIYLLAAEHADAIQELLADPATVAGTRIPHPYPENGASEFIARHLEERARGTAWTFAIMDRGTLVGVCGMHGIGNARAEEIGYWVGRPHWGKGYASFGVKMVLEFAFNNLRLEQVGALTIAGNLPSRRVLEKNGFELLREEFHPDPLEKGQPSQVALYTITRARWLAHRDGPALAALHPALQTILHAELAAGNEVVETGGGWPDPDSIFVRLRRPFRARPASLPEGVVYTELNDPHWWLADYGTLSPRHTLACSRE